MIGAWIGILTKPEETVAAEKASASLVKGLINFVIAAIIIGVIIGLIIGLLAGLASIAASLVPGLESLAGLGLMAIIGVPILVVFLVVICSLIYNLALWISAKIVGGTGSFGVQYYLISLLAVPVLLAFIVVFVVSLALMFVPFIGGLIGMLLFYAIMGYISIIGTMAYISAIKETHGLSTMNTALATGISMAIVMIIVFILALIILMPLIAGLGLPGSTGFGIE